MDTIYIHLRQLPIARNAQTNFPFMQVFLMKCANWDKTYEWLRIFIIWVYTERFVGILYK